MIGGRAIYTKKLSPAGDRAVPDDFWINNPTRRQADLALENGAPGCTNNPSYTQKMLDHPEEAEYARALLDEAIAESEDDWQAAEIFQRKMVKPIAEKFMPLFEQSGGQHGYVSIQGDPINEDDPNVVIRDALPTARSHRTSAARSPPPRPASKPWSSCSKKTPP